MEGLEVVEVVMTDRHHYARLFTELWQAGEGFVLIEHDIVPWPGAVTELQDCSREWCAFEYPNGVIRAWPPSGWCASLGCVKFSAELLRRIPYDTEWQNRGWDELDGAVFATLQGKAEVHMHHPAVAHVKARTLVLRREEYPR